MDDQSHKYYKTPGCQDSSLRREGGEGTLKKKKKSWSQQGVVRGDQPLYCAGKWIQRCSRMYGFMHASAHSCVVGRNCVFEAVSVCCSPQKLSLRASVQFEVDQGVSRCHVVQAAAAVHRCCNGRYLLLTCSPHTITELCGGNLCLYYVSPLPPYSLLFLPSLSVVSASVLQGLFCHPHTHKDTRTHALLSSSSRFLIFAAREREWVQKECSLLAWLRVSISVHWSGLASPPPFIQI